MPAVFCRLCNCLERHDRVDQVYRDAQRQESEPTGKPCLGIERDLVLLP